MKKTKRRVSRKTYEGIISSDRVPAQLKKGWEKKIKRKGYGYLREGDRQIPKYEIFGMAILIILAFSIVFLRIVPTAQVVGVGEEYSSEILSIGQMLTATYSQELVVIGELNSLKLSGYMQEGTQANIYLVSSGGQQLIADSNSILSEGQIESQDNETFIRTFSDICADTCEVSLESGEYTIQVEVLEGELYLENANYVVYTNIGSSVLEEIEELENEIEQASDKKEKVSKEEKDEVKQEKKEEKVEVKEEKAAAKEEESEILEENVIVGEIVEEISEPIEVLDENVEEETTLQYEAVIGQPVKWKKRIVLITADDNVSITLPDLAEKIIIKDENNETVTQATIEGISVADSEFSGISGAALIDKGDYLGESLYWLGKFLRDLVNSGVGFVVYEENPFLDDGDIDIIVEELVEHVEIEYETPAPQAEETQTEKGKQVVVSSQVDYSNVLTFAEIPNTEVETIKLYWSENSTLPRREVTSDPQVNLQMYDTDGDNLVDYLEWNTPHTSNQTFEIELTILNVQSYPVVGGNWTVQFNTTGVANLTIAAFNGTTWSQNATVEDLEFLELRCGEELVNYTWVDGEVRVSNYSCNETSGETSQVLTTGSHHINFTFGDQSASAHNWAYSRSQAQALLYLPMDEGTGSVAYDVSGKGNDGTLVNGTAWTSGYFGKGLNLNNNTGDYISVSDSASLDINNSFSMSVWIKPNGNIDDTISLLGKWDHGANGRSYYLYALATNQIGGATSEDGSWDADKRSNAESSDSVIVPNEWNFVTMTYNSSTGIINVYHNGVNVTTATNFYTDATYLNVNNLDFGIGSTFNSGTSSRHFNGTIDEVQLHNYTLTSEEVEHLYRGYDPNEGQYGQQFGMDSSVVAYFPFDESNVTNPIDYSDLLNNGTKMNNTSSSSTEPASVTGKFGNGLSFDGTDDWVNTSVTANLSNGSFSVFTWVKDVPSGNAYVIAQARQLDPSYASDWILGYSNGGLWMRSQSIDGGNVISDGGWHYTGFTFNGTDAFLYIDGNYIGTATIGQAGAVGSVNIMTRGDATVSFSSGKIDEVLIVNRTLTESEILNLYRGLPMDHEDYYQNQIETQSLLNSPDLMLYYPMDELSGGTIYDNSSYMRNGTLMNTVDNDTVHLGENPIGSGGSLDFDGSNDYIDTDYIFSGSQISFSTWVKLKDTPSTDFVFGTLNNTAPYYGYGFYFDSNTDIIWYNYNGSNNGIVNYDAGIQVGQWYHYAGTFNGTHYALYINGSLIVTNASTFFVQPTDIDMFVGARHDRTDPDDAHANITIDEFMIFNRSLTDAEVLLLYNGTSTFSESMGCTFSDNQTMSEDLDCVDLTISSGGVLDANGYSINATGDVDITGTLHGRTGDHWFGSLTINSGGTYNATSGVTTITNESSVGRSAYNNGGTFTTNSGILNITTPATTDVRGFSPYDLEISSGNIVTWQGPSGDFTVSNDLTVTSGTFVPKSNGYKLTVTGDVDVTGTLGQVGWLDSGIFGSLTINSGGIYYATSGTTTITSKTVSGFGITLASGLASLIQHNNGLFNMTGSDYQAIYLGTSTATDGIYNLEIAKSAQPATWVGTTVIYNDLTIDAGLFKAESNTHTLTVIGDVDVTGTLGEGDETGALTFGSLTINSGGTYDATSGTTTITSESGSGFAIKNLGTFTHNNGLVNISYGDSTGIDLDENSLYDLTTDVTMLYSYDNPLTIDNDLTVTGGVFRAVTDSARPMIVTGDVLITGGTLGRGGTETNDHSFGSLTINSGGTYDATSGTTTITSETAGGFAIDHDGTLTANSGLINITTGDDTNVDIAASGNLYDIEISSGNAVYWTTDTTIDNDVIVSSGTFTAASATRAITVTGDVDVTGTLGAGGWTAAASFGSLTINSGGTYSATSGTTTLTDASPAGQSFSNSGTFTHNNGLVNITKAGSTKIQQGVAFYDLEIATGSTVRSGTNNDIANDLIISSGTFYMENVGQTLDVTGDVSITGRLGLVSSTAWSGAVSMGSLTINSGGIYDATTGTTTVLGNWDNDGTFTHNEGEVKFDTGSTHTTITGSTETVFYDLKSDDDTYMNPQVRVNTTVVNNFVINGFSELDGTSNTVTLTMGNSSQAGTISKTAGELRLNDNTINFVKIKGASSSYPAVISSNSAIDWDKGDANSLVRLENIDAQATQTTGGTNVDITLDGDCEFDAFTVSSGDTLDLNGQRAEFGGLLNVDGVLDFGNNGLLLATTTDFDGSFSGDNITTILTTTGTSDVADGDLTMNGNLFINPGTGNTVTQDGNWNTFVKDNVFIGSGTLVTSNSNLQPTNLTVATGGILDGGSSTITIPENWKSSGGLIGKSALDLDGSSEYVDAGDDVSFDITSAITIEAWVKPDAIGSVSYIVSRDDNTNRNYWLALNADGTTGSVLSGLTTTSVISNTSLTVDKWYHIVMTYDGSNFKSYIDGKLEASAASTGSIDNDDVSLTIGAREDGADRWFNGTIGRVSIYNTSLSESEIREGMFEQCLSMPNQTNLVSCYQFDEGTGTTVADSIGGNDGTASGTGVWASAGTFTYGTSTVNLTSASDVNVTGMTGVYNLEVPSAPNFYLERGNLSVYGNATIAGDVTVDTSQIFNMSTGDEASFGSLTINSGGTYHATSGTTTISGNLTNAGTFTNNSGIVLFDGASSYVTNTVDLNNVTVSGNATLLAAANYTKMNVTSTGNLTYAADQSDSGTYYHKAPSGFVSLTNSSTLTSLLAYFNDSQILDNTTGTALWLDSVETGSFWNATGWNQAPVFSSVELIPASPQNSQNLQVNVTCYDTDAGDSITAYWDLYNDSTKVAGLVGSGSATNNTSTTLTVATSGNTSVGQQWLAEVWCGDGTANTSKTNATAVTIVADPIVSSPGGSPSSIGGYAKTAVGQFIIDPMEIIAPLPRKGFKVYEFIITSESEEDIEIEIDTSQSNGHVSLIDNEFTISGQRSNKIKVTVLAGTQLGTSAGKLIFRSDIKTVNIPIIVEVESERVIFDSKIDVSPIDKIAQAGDILTTHVTLLPVGPRERIVDAIVKYTIRDLDNNILYTESETFAVDEQKSYDKEIPIPDDLPAGSYIVNMDVLYENSFATSSSLFEVEEEGSQATDDSNRLIAIILVIIIPLSLYLLVSAVKRFRK